MSDLFAELRRHANGAHEYKARVNMVLDSVSQVLKLHRSGGESATTSPSAVEYFGAIMTTIDSDKDRSYVGELTYLLSFVLPNVPVTVLRVKFAQISGFLSGLLLSEDDIGGGSVYKNLLSCLGCLVDACGTDAELLKQKAVQAAITLLLQFTIDKRPKARKEAHRILVKLLKQHNEGGSKAIGDRTAKFCTAIMAKVNKDTDDATQALQLMTLLHTVLHQLPQEAAGKLSQSLLRLASSSNQLLVLGCLKTLSGYVTEVTKEADSSVSANISSLLVSVLKLPIIGSATPLVAAECAPLIALLLIALEKSDPASCTEHLPSAIKMIASYYASDDRGLTKSVQTSLKLIFSSCISEDMVIAAKEAGAKESSCLKEIISVLESLANIKLSHSWGAMVEPLTAFFARLGSLEAAANGCGVLLNKFLLSMVELYEGGIDTAGEYAKHVYMVLGSVVEFMGPQLFLDIVSLSSKDAPGLVHPRREWVLPLLEENIKSYPCSLDYYGKNILKLARAHDSASREEGTMTTSAKHHAAKVLSLWRLLPVWCASATDTSTVFASMAPVLAGAASNSENPELGKLVALSITRLIVTNQRALLSGDSNEDRLPSEFSRLIEEDEEGAGHGSDGSDADDASDGDDEDEDIAPKALLTAAESAEVRSKNVLAPFAADSLKSMSPFANRFVPVLFTIYDKSHGTWAEPPAAAPHLGLGIGGDASVSTAVLDAIAAYASIAPVEVINQLFQALIKKMLAAITVMGVDGTEGGGDARRTAVVAMGLVSALVKPLSAADLALLYRVVEPTISSGNFGLLQQRSYAVLLAMCSSHADWVTENVAAVTDLLRGSLLTVTSSAKKSRLKSLVFVIKALDESKDENLSLMPELLGEVILCLKESNRRARSAAFDLLVTMAKKMRSAGSVHHSSTMSIAEFVKMVLAGLAAKTPHMRSATVLALARLVFEFKEESSVMDLTPTILKLVLLLLHEKSREVVKSVLGFTKVSISSVHVDALRPFLPNICEGILTWSGDTKNRFRMKIRHIVERLVRKFGFDLVQEHIPEKDAKLLAHIRRTKDRNARKKHKNVVEAASAPKGMEVEGSAADEISKADGNIEGAEDDEDNEGNGEEGDADGDESEEEMTRDEKWLSQAKSAISRSSGAWLRSDTENPLDLLDSSRMARGVSAMDPRRAARGGADDGEDTDEDIAMDAEGRLVIKDDDKSAGDITMADGSKAGRMIAPSEPVDKKHGKNKRKRDDDDEEGEDGDAPAAGPRGRGSFNAAGPKRLKGRDGKSVPRGTRGGSEFKAKKAGGDLQKGALQPFAYLPLDHRFLNRKKKREAPRQYANLVQAGRGGKAEKLAKNNRNASKY